MTDKKAIVSGLQKSKPGLNCYFDLTFEPEVSGNPLT